MRRPSTLPRNSDCRPEWRSSRRKQSRSSVLLPSPWINSGSIFSRDGCVGNQFGKRRMARSESAEEKVRQWAARINGNHRLSRQHRGSPGCSDRACPGGVNGMACAREIERARPTAGVRRLAQAQFAAIMAGLRRTARVAGSEDPRPRVAAHLFPETSHIEGVESEL